MSKNLILVVTEDIYVVQTYSGFWGKAFKKVYIFFFALRLKTLINYLGRKNQLIILAADTIIDLVNRKKYNKNIKFFKYSENLEIKVDKYRKESQQLTGKISKSIFQLINKDLQLKDNPFELWWTQTAMNFSYYFFPYYNLIDQLTKRFKPLEFWTLGKSQEDKIAFLVSQKNKIKFNYFSFFDPSWINNYLKKILFSRFIKKITKSFVSKTETKTINRKKDFYKDSTLLIVDFFRHFRTLVPLYKKFKEKKEKIFFVLTDIKMKKMLRDLYGINQDYFFLQDLISTSLLNGKIKLIKNSYLKVWKSFQKKITDSNHLSIWKLFEDYFEVVIKQILPLAHLYLEAGNKFISKNQPKGIICINDIRMLENTFLTLGRRHKIKTMIVHPSAFLSADKVSRFQCDYFSSVGKYIREELINIGYPKEKIKVNGDPQFDFLADQKKLALDPDKKIILLISDRPNSMLSYGEKRDQFNKVAKAVEEFGDVQLVIKPHPTESRESLLADLKTWQIKNVLVSDNSKIELFELLSLASIVIIAWSMTGFEAMLFKIPVIVANFTNKDYDLFIPYVKGEGAASATNLDDLKRLIRIFITQKNKERIKQVNKGKKFCQKYYRLPFGGASERIHKLLINRAK